MPFEPRILPNDDQPNGDLPNGGAGPERDRQRSDNRPRFEPDEFDSPDLELLAGQLSDDADYLARLYPPGSVRARPAVVRRVWTGARADLWRLAAAAAVLLMLGAGGPLGVWLAQNRPEPDVANRAKPEEVATSDDGAFDASAADANLLAGADSENPIQAETGTAGLVHTILSGELSPSEQEAVFDLLEDEPTELARVSL